MKKSTINCRSRDIMRQIIFALFFFTSPFTGLYAACCAGHEGVASCNKSTGQQLCKDGSISPTCKCAAFKTTKKSAVSPNKAAPTTTTITKPKSSWWGTKSTTTTHATTKSTAPTTIQSKSNWWNGKSTSTTKGCCSRHGGVAHCNKVSGYQMCKDGTQSSSCACP